MRVDIDQKVDWLVRWERMQGRKVSGRKHKERKGQKHNDREKAHLQRSEKERKRKGAKYKKAVSDFWAGKIEAFPKKEDFGIA